MIYRNTNDEDNLFNQYSFTKFKDQRSSIIIYFINIKIYFDISTTSKCNFFKHIYARNFVINQQYFKIKILFSLKCNYNEK